MPVKIPQAHSIGDMIDGQLSSTPGQYQFPSDRPKYYTTLTLEKYGTQASAPGGWGNASVTKLAEALVSWGVSSSWDDAVAKAGAWARSMMPDVTMPQGGTAPVTTESIILPLPIQLKDVHKVHWDEKPINPWALAVRALGIDRADPIKVIAGLFGIAPNYFHTILFDRPEYKRHELTFKLAPRNFEEADHIANIIMVLNNAMSPGLAAGDFVFTFPNVVQVAFRPNAGFLFKFKPCVIEAIAVDYAGSGGKKAFYHDPPGSGGQANRPLPGGSNQGQNPPESVEFTMQLCEIEYWIQGQFNRANA